MTDNSKSGGMRDNQPKPSVGEVDGLPTPAGPDQSKLAAAASRNDQPKASEGGDR
jgi:hypothetical protein